MNLTIKVSDTQINCEDVVKLLGVDIDYQLNFDQHISNLCRKAGQQLNVLERLCPFLSRLNKLTIFHTFILSNSNYCPLAWHFCSEINSKKLEKIQERAYENIVDHCLHDCSYFDNERSEMWQEIVSLSLPAYGYLYMKNISFVSNVLLGMKNRDLEHILGASQEAFQICCIRNIHNIWRKYKMP